MGETAPPTTLVPVEVLSEPGNVLDMLRQLDRPIYSIVQEAETQWTDEIKKLRQVNKDLTSDLNIERKKYLEECVTNTKLEV